MVKKLFRGRAPSSRDALLDPGCGDGEFIAGVIEECERRAWPVPRIVGVELDLGRAAFAKRRFQGHRQVEIHHADFLGALSGVFQFIVGNPPYVPITGLSLPERERYRSSFATAAGRFDLYVLFFERAISLLAPAGRLVLVTPEKFLYVESARALRSLLAERTVEELHLLDETTFPDRVTYPLVTTVVQRRSTKATVIRSRNGARTTATLGTADSWLPHINGTIRGRSAVSLADVTLRVSCGVATGADSAFVIHERDLPSVLAQYAHPTIAGRQILPDGSIRRDSCLLAPYDHAGRLLPERQLGALGAFLREEGRRSKLQARTCVGRKPWYAFHDNFPVEEMLRPKLICKDITERPFFVIDRSGSIVPRHSVYYIVPAMPGDLEGLAEYLNSDPARAWLRANCQRAANGFMRLQSQVLKRLPLPASFAPRLGALDSLRDRVEALPA